MLWWAAFIFFVSSPRLCTLDPEEPLNYGYDWLRENYSNIKYLIQMDADSILANDFIKNTVHALSRKGNQGIGALSCAFVGKSNLAKNKWQATVMWFQHLEYVKFHDSGILRNVSVVSGTGCALRISALEEIRLRRGHVWATDSLVEDYELSLQIRTNGWQTRKSGMFRVYTDLMPSVRSLVKQRERWQRGTFDELRRYGFNRFTAIDHLKQWFHGLGLILNLIVIVYLGWMIASGQFRPTIFALSLLFLIMARQAYHARSLGWRWATLTGTLLPDLTYGTVRNFWWLKSFALSLGRSEKRWT